MSGAEGKAVLDELSEVEQEVAKRPLSTAALRLFLGLFLAYWSFVYLRNKEWLRLSSLVRGFAVIAVVWFAASSPLIVPGLRTIFAGDFFLPGGDEYFSGDLLTFVTPSPLWGPGTAFVFPHATTSLWEARRALRIWGSFPCSWPASLFSLCGGRHTGCSSGRRSS